MASTAYSIHQDLLGDNYAHTDPAALGGRATTLIRLVLRAAADQAVDGSFNILTGFSIVKTARESCDTVDATIDEIEAISGNDDVDDVNGWNIFNKYVDGIHSLEELIIDLKLFNPHPANLAAENIIDGLTEIRLWETDRKALSEELAKLHALLHKLRGIDPAPPLSNWEQQRDDVAILRRLLILLGANANDTSAM
ncbi:hypothetical protein CPB86DRAFT_748250 [Serendipita vermifera]|nr:hypothetical protein CPB86DRAFT_748250 [Serendipita vermifera]